MRTPNESVHSSKRSMLSIRPSFPLHVTTGSEAYNEQCAEFERLVSSPYSTATGEHRRNDSSTRWRHSLTSSRRSSTPTSVRDPLLVHDGRLAGVIDWGDMRVGDPALDYSYLLAGPFADWDVDADLRRRARFYDRLAPWYAAHYGLLTNQPAHTEVGLSRDQRQTLRRLVPRALDVSERRPSDGSMDCPSVRECPLKTYTPAVRANRRRRERTNARRRPVR